MGRFTYGPKITADFDDRLLAHLQAVIAAKVRRGESFMFTWIDDDATGDGRTSVWVNPAVALGFKYFGKRSPTINRDWIEELMLSANSVTGLHISPEPHGSSGVVPTAERTVTVAKRIAIQYGDSEYAISGRELPDVVAEIEAGVSSGAPTWLEVAIGQGRATPAQLLLGPGIPIAVWQVNVGEREVEREPGPVETDAV